MNKNIYHIPDNFIKTKTDNANIVFYVSNESNRRSKVTLNENLICFVQEGAKQIHAESTDHQIDSSELLIVNSGNVLMTERTSIKNNYRSLLLFFPNELLSEVTKQFQATESDHKQYSAVTKIRKDDFLKNFQQSVEILKKGKQLTGHLSDLKIIELITYLVKIKPQLFRKPAKQSTLTAKKNHLKSVILINSAKNLTVDEMAFLCHMSVSTFKRHFFDCFGSTPRQYLIKLKMEKALSKLENGFTPTQVSIELGYKNLSAFSSAFKKFYGLAPSKSKLVS